MEFGVFGGQIWPIIGRSHRLRLVTLTPPSSQCTRLESACADHDSVSSCACKRAADAAQGDADRRSLDGLSGFLCASCCELLDLDWSAHHWGVRVYLDVVHLDARRTTN